MKLAPRFRVDVKCAISAWGDLSPSLLRNLLELLKRYRLSVVLGDLVLIDLHWYITHAGLLRLAVRKRCSGIHVQLVKEFCDTNSSRYAFKALVYGSPECKGFIGYGDADPSNVSPLVRGAEMRVAETRSQSCSAKNLWNRHLFSRGNRIIRFSARSCHRIQKASAGNE